MSDRFDRQILMFGQEGQKNIEATHVGIVGLGGIGSQVVQALAYLGVRSYVLVDDDHADVTNSNRLITATPGDAERGLPKTDLAEQYIKKIQPQAEIVSIRSKLQSIEVLEALVQCPIIFGCVDHDGPRLILTELAAAYNCVLIDSAVEVEPEDGSQLGFGGRVVVSVPGEFCLSCAQEIDMERAKWELQPESTKSVRIKHGYGLGENNTAPSVVSLNGVVANLAVTEFLCMVTGLRKPQQYLHYDGFRGRVFIRTDGQREGCYVCGALTGMKDEADIFRYATEA